MYSGSKGQSIDLLDTRSMAPIVRVLLEQVNLFTSADDQFLASVRVRLIFLAGNNDLFRDCFSRL